MVSLSMKKLFLLLELIFLLLPPLPGLAASYDEHVANICRNTHLDKKIIRLALEGYQYANMHVKINKNVLTIVDYSQPSVMKRLYVIDLNTDQLLMNTWVAHGHNTGNLLSPVFNSPESKESSLGVFVTKAFTLVMMANR